MTAPTARLAYLFSCVGHFYFHMFTMFYFIIVVTLEVEWDRPYHELIGLWTLGSLLVGLAALPAGRLGDRWSAPGMMVVFFTGMGAAAIFCALASGPTALMIGLAGIGLFGAIYHPIGIPWIIRGAKSRTGKLLAVNGAFGSIGTAAAALVVGVLIDGFGWRAAFFVPGIVCLATGIAMLWLWKTGRIADQGPGQEEAEKRGGRADMLRAFLILLAAMFLGGIIYHGAAAAIPKLFAERLADFTGDGAFGVGLLVSIVYAAGAVMQLVGGHLADRYPLKTVYLLHWACAAVFLVGVALASGIGLIGATMLAVMFNLSQIPAQSMMLARCTPVRHHGVAFGAQFVLMFCAAPLAIQIIAWVRAETGSFEWLFFGFAAAAAAIVCIGLALPRGAVSR